MSMGPDYFTPSRVVLGALGTPIFNAGVAKTHAGLSSQHLPKYLGKSTQNGHFGGWATGMSFP
jgi:hypothetical protein